MAPFEGLVPGSIADVWFVHERGLRTAIFNLGVLGGVNVAGPISGSIYQNYGFGALYYGMAGGFILMGLLVFFFMPESCYHRSRMYNFDVSSHDVYISLPDLPAPTLTNCVGSRCCARENQTSSSRIRRRRSLSRRRDRRRRTKMVLHATTSPLEWILY